MLARLSAIVRRAGAMVRSADISRAELEVKSSPGDFVTQYDIAVQDMLRQELQKLLPAAEFVGEESGLVNRHTDGCRFIVDPIDGTANFAWDYHHSAVCVGLAYQDQMRMGLVYNPYLDELFYAEAGQGAFLNGKRIYASQRRLQNGLVIFGSSPYDKAQAERTFGLAKHLYLNALDVRRSGSAALDICYIACGRGELFYEMSLAPWDYAAASLIAREAGGIITTLQGESLRLDGQTSVLAGGRQAYADFRRLYQSLEQAGLII